MKKTEFAKALGFKTYEDLMAYSEVIAHEKNDVQWYITKLPDGRWAAWDDAELDIDRVEYAEYEISAIDHIYDGLVIAGYDCTSEPVIEKYRLSACQGEGNEWSVKAYGHKYYVVASDADEAIQLVLSGRGEHDPTCA